MGEKREEEIERRRYPKVVNVQHCAMCELSRFHRPIQHMYAHQEHRLVLTIVAVITNRMCHTQWELLYVVLYIPALYCIHYGALSHHYVRMVNSTSRCQCGHVAGDQWPLATKEGFMGGLGHTTTE